jgi:hypothetical protein
MPSWSATNPPDKTDTQTATAVARARRLLEQLFSGRPREGEQQPSPPPKP